MQGRRRRGRGGGRGLARLCVRGSHRRRRPAGGRPSPGSRDGGGFWARAVRTPRREPVGAGATTIEGEETTLGSVTELSHTADVGFELRAASLEGLFGAAAEGLARARGADPDRDAGADTEDVELSRPGLDRLLVAWLRELLHRAMRDDAVPEASVEEVAAPGAADGQGEPGASGDTSPGGAADTARLRARVRWRPAADEPVREIKGITYHGLEVRRDDDGDWHARVVLDV